MLNSHAFSRTPSVSRLQLIDMRQISSSKLGLWAWLIRRHLRRPSCVLRMKRCHIFMAKAMECELSLTFSCMRL